MTTLMQDLQYALRQLKKTPGFTITVLLTLALGRFGANAAIFTLVNSVLLKNLPVADPNTLVRLGNNSHDCCVGFNGVRDNPNYSNFSTDTYQRQLKKNVPEFAELAAMQAGFTYRPIVARRGGANAREDAFSNGRVCVGKLFHDIWTASLRLAGCSWIRTTSPVSRQRRSSAITLGSMSCGGDPAVVGSTFWVNTKPVTVVGVAPRGFYGDRMTNTPPDYYLADRDHGSARECPLRS